ncbi:MAG: AsmA family protein [Candidatus Acidiferrum sp.]
MKRWTKILLALVGLVVLGVASIPFFMNANTFRPTIETQLKTTLGRSVKLGDLSLSLFSASLVAKDLSVADDPNFNAAPFLTAKEIRIGVLLWPLIFSRKVNLQSIQIKSPQITLIRAVNGTWNFSSIGRLPASGAFTDAASGISKGAATEFPALTVGRIFIEDGCAMIASLPARGQPRVYEHINLSVRDFSLDSQFPFELRANLPAGGAVHISGHVGPLNRVDAATSPADAQISIKRLDPVAAGFLAHNAGLSFLADIEMRSASDGHILTTNGTMHIQNLKLRKGAAAAPEPLDFAYSGAQLLKENTVQIEDAMAKIGDAAIHVSGTFQPEAIGGVDPELNLKLTGQSLPINELQHLMTAAGVRLPNGAVLSGGMLALNLVIIGPAKSLVISGAIALDNTRLVGFDIGSKIHGIAALSGLKTGDTTNIERLRVNVRITNEIVVVDEIDAVIPAVGELTGNGTVSSADELDFNLIAKIDSAQGIGKVGAGLLTKLNGSDETSKNMTGVPLRVLGTPEDPNITADVGGIFQKKKKSIAAFFGKKK